MMVLDRHLRLLRNANKISCNAVLSFEPENIYYITGFWGEGAAICTENSTYLAVPKLEVNRAEQVCRGKCQIISTDRGADLINSLVPYIKGLSVCTDCKDNSILELINNLTGSTVQVNAEPLISTRMIKDYEEIQLISKAAAIIDTLYQISSKEIRAGLSERQLQAKLVYESMVMGGNPPSYRSTLNPFIVAGGPNGALPHAEVSDREFKNGDMVVIDLTLRYNGYIADATRTFALASVSSEMKEVYEIVRRSQELGLQAARSGASCHSVDNECRKYIQEKGYAKFFIHSTGHGIGLDVHEPPWLRSKNEETLKNNMAITVEPGIYMPEKFGVRIEDSLIIQDNGMPKVLNHYTKDLVSVG